MNKKFILILSLLLVASINQMFAQLPEVSTSTHPRWYYIKVQGSDAGRKDRVFTNETNKIFGREQIYSNSFTDMNKQLWRFEQDAEGHYMMINKAASARKLDIVFDAEKNIVQAVLSLNPTTSWSLVQRGNYYSIQAVTPISGKTGYRYAHQANSSGERNYAIMMETTTWASTADSYFSFVPFEDPNLVMSNDKSQTWYVIKSNKAGYEGKCITDVTGASLADIQFGINDYEEGNTNQLWKAVKKVASVSDTRFDLVNKATGNIIQTDYSLHQGYYYTQAAQDLAASNGWQVTYFGKDAYSIFGTNADGLKRYLNATLAGDVPDSYNADNLSGTGFSWGFEKVLITDIDELMTEELSDSFNAYSEGHRIYVIGADDYVIRTVTGVVVSKDSTLPAGIYLVTANGETKKMINQ